ncbi:Asparagine synthetase [glutamine-hydrolyzing] 1 [Magnetospirillum gryphiswaldense MSR-1]|nr:Asparagine synthetase [glutamine-hydrolyzing] 1 [Magnetospirillum gryphiswaldense MSR-1]AVM79476.1 Asparagine synthetase [glutamine-hydrolyzing] 1 [Magnetospirillum gryphiswaldense]
MTTALAHRGPDGQGQWLDDRVALGHRRLSVIDLSDHASQPMIGPSGAVLVFNGEIYNFRELRKTLEEAGNHFRTDSDTEVLLRLWEIHGPQCLSMLIGMFAFALWDAQRGRVFLARDRLGKKPLYYCRNDHGMAFASEVKALMALPKIAANAEIDPLAMSDFLSLGYILTPKSAFRNISRLPAAHYAEYNVNNGSWQCFEYWRLEEHFLSPRLPHNKEINEQFMDLLTDAVRLRLRSDVPVGIFLSGGMDSSAVAAIAAGLDKASTKAFCVGFHEQSYDESVHAQAVADHLGIPLTILENRPADDALIQFLIGQVDEPFADTSIMPTYLLNENARKHVTVALTGDGADEILAGYPTYRANSYHKVVRRLPRGVMGGLSRMANHMLRPRYRKVGWDYKVRQFLRGHALSPEQAHYSWRTVFSEAEKHQLMGAELVRSCRGYDPFTTFAEAFAKVQGANFLDQSLFVDTKTWLQDDILVKADRASMAASLEIRSPFLDHRLVEFTARLPVSAKMDLRRQKIILKDVMKDILPDRVMRRRKAGFNAPTLSLQKTALSHPGPDGWFNQSHHLDPRREDITYKSFSLAMLGAWLQLFERFRETGYWKL